MNYLLATLAIVTCHILTGSASVITRYLVSELDPVEIAFLRYLFGGIFILPALYFTSLRINRYNLLKTILLGILFFALFPYLFSSALKYTTSARGSLVLASMPLWAVLLSHVFKHDKVQLRTILGLSIVMLGLVIAIQDRLSDAIGDSQGLIGEGLMLLAAFTGGLYSVLAKSTLREISANLFTPIAMFSGTVFLLPWAYQADRVDTLLALPDQYLWLILYLGCITGGLAFFLMNWAINKTTAVMVTMFTVVHPLSAIILARILLQQELSRHFFLGSAIVFAGLVISQWPSRKLMKPG